MVPFGHELMGERRFRKREDAIDHRLQLTARDQVPDLPIPIGRLVGRQGSRAEAEHADAAWHDLPKVDLYIGSSDKSDRDQATSGGKAIKASPERFTTD
jgi:hypothetical protein